MIVRGYTRILPGHQDLAREKESLQRAGASDIHTELSPAGQIRMHVLDDLVNQCATGDLIVVLSLNRLGRSMDEILNTVALLDKQMLYISSLNDGFDSRTDEGGVLSTFLDALRTAKGTLAGELTQTGMQLYANSGKKIGRPPVDKQALKLALDLVFSGLPVAEAAQNTGISAPTLHRYLAKERALRST